LIPSIYPKELEINETKETASSASFPGIYLKFETMPCKKKSGTLH
jgi:hypothetical protein